MPQADINVALACFHASTVMTTKVIAITSFLSYWHNQILIITPRGYDFGILKKKQKQKQKNKKNKKNILAKLGVP